MDELSKKIKELRLQKGLTLQDIGDKVGVGKRTVLKWDNGIIENMRRDKIAKLADALGVSPAYLMGWENSDTSSAPPVQNTLSPDQEELLSYYDQLNSEGKAEALKQVSNLAKIKDYREDTPSSKEKMA